MKQKRNDFNKENDRKISGKDIVIVALSVIALCLLIAVIMVSNARDKELSEYLENNKAMTTDDVIATLNSGIEDYLTISEVSSDKWIELYNSGSENIDVSGIKVFVGEAQVATIPEGSLVEKEGVLAIDISEKINGTCVVSLRTKEGETFRSVVVPGITNGKSYGIADYEENIWGYMEASKGKVNSQAEAIFANYDGIGFSAPGGFYDNTFNLELSCSEGETIYYTTDGTAPTKESAQYDGAIKITNQSGTHYVYTELGMGYAKGTNYFPATVDGGMIVRAIAVDKAGNIKKTASQAYYVGLRKDTDYLNLPVLSITSDPENLFDYEEGIYVSGRAGEEALIQNLSGGHGNYYNNWKKPAKIEYYEPSKDKTFEMNVDMSIRVDDATATNQKNMVFSLGENEYSMFEGSSVLKYISDSSKLTIIQNDIDNTTKLRSYLIDTMAQGLSVGTQDIMPCTVFVDGEYWGLYYILADYDKKYLENRYGLSGEEFSIREPGKTTRSYQQLTDYVSGTDLSVKDNYEKLKTMMDVDNYAEYICLNIYVGNSEFYPRNGYAWRTMTDSGSGYADGRWRFLCAAMNHSMNYSKRETATMNTYLQIGMQSDLMFQSLMMNEEFRNTLYSTMERMAHEVFEESMALGVLDELKELIKKPAIASVTRFSSKLTENGYDLAVQAVEKYLQNRPDNILKYTKEMTEKGGNIEKAKEYLEEEAKKKANTAKDLVDNQEAPIVDDTEAEAEQQSATEGLDNNGG